MISSSQSNLVIVFCSCPSETLAKDLANGILKNRLAGCVKVLPVQSSIYLWKGNLVNETESLMIIKTLNFKVGELERYILDNHDYETPEVVTIPVLKATEDYMVWIEQCIT